MTTRNLIIHRAVLMLSLFTLALLTAQAQSLTEAAKADSRLTSQKLSATATPAPAPTPAPLRVGSLTISGSVRARLESWDWFDTSAANGNYNFGAVTLRLGIGQQQEKFEWQVEGAFPWLMNVPDHAIAPAPQGQLGLGGNYFAASGRQDASAILKQAYLRFKGIGGDKASSLKLGRFEFNDGTEMTPTDATLATIKRDHIAQRLIGTFGFSHVGRSFDGVQYGRNAKSGNFTFLAARPTEGVFQLKGNAELDVDFYYGAFTRPFKFKTGEGEMRAFALHYHDGRRVLKIDNRAATLRAADADNIRITTLGGHYIGAYKAGRGRVDVLLWGAGQFGGWGQLDHRAGAIAAEAGYQFSGRLADKIKPWVRAGYFRSTGDGDATDTTHGTYFQVLPTPRIYARFPFFNQMNNEDAFAQLRLKPHAKFSLRADVHRLRLSSAKDLWYAGGGAFQAQTFGYAARPSGGRQSLGTLADVSIDYNVTARTTLTCYLGGVRGGGVAGSIYPEGRHARFAYLEFTQKF